MEEPTDVNGKRKKGAYVVFGVLALVSAVVLYFYLNYKATHISTDDAFVDGRIHTIASKVPGTVRKLYVTDNQPVKKGDLLVEIDPEDYAVKVSEASSGVSAETAKLAEADARIVTVNTQLAELQAAVSTAKASLLLQEANLRQAESDLNRAQELDKKGYISKEQFEKAQTARDVMTAQVQAAQDQLRQAQQAIETQKAMIRQTEMARTSQLSAIREKEAKLKAAELSLDYTRLFAPADGYVTKRSVEVGNQIQAGQPLMAVVPLNDIWVTANYKETQLDKVKPGQNVKISVDMFPGMKFNGKIDSIMSGTGAVFSLFPPENATGNYVKIVQRIPVKIVLDSGTDPDRLLRIGMSVVPTIVIEK